MIAVLLTCQWTRGQSCKSPANAGQAHGRGEIVLEGFSVDEGSVARHATGEDTVQDAHGHDGRVVVGKR
jgi:hypothetical protein